MVFTLVLCLLVYKSALTGHSLKPPPCSKSSLEPTAPSRTAVARLAGQCSSEPSPGSAKVRTQRSPPTVSALFLGISNNLRVQRCSGLICLNRSKPMDQFWWSKMFNETAQDFFFKPESEPLIDNSQNSKYTLCCQSWSV